MTAKNPETYKAPHPVYTGGKLYNPGDPFVTDETKGEKWEKVKPAEKAAADASDKVQRSDVPLEVLSKYALEAVAYMKGVNPDGLGKDDLIAGIKAADEPAL